MCTVNELRKNINYKKNTAVQITADRVGFCTEHYHRHTEMKTAHRVGFWA